MELSDNWCGLFRHVGDLGNVVATNGEVQTTFSDHVVSLYGEQTVIGRSFVVCIVDYIH